MSPVWLKMIPLLCLCCRAQSSSESGGVIRRAVGKNVNIQCRSSGKDIFSMTLRKGLNEDTEVFFKEMQTTDAVILGGFKGRLQFNGEGPNVDILIQNLTFEDTDPYWCTYTKYDSESGNAQKERGSGSVLLVVTEDTVQVCEPQHFVLVSVIISAVVLIGIIIGLLMWIIHKTKTLRKTTVTPRRVATNDVYEDMRGTFRR